MHSLSLLVFAGVAFVPLAVVIVWCAANMLKSSRSDILVSAPVTGEQ